MWETWQLDITLGVGLGSELAAGGLALRFACLVHDFVESGGSEMHRIGSGDPAPDLVVLLVLDRPVGVEPAQAGEPSRGPDGGHRCRCQLGSMVNSQRLALPERQLWPD